MAANAFSADVRLTLRLSDQDVSIAQVGPDFFHVAHDYGVIPPQEGILILQVDDYRSETPIRMLNAIDGDYCEVKYERIGEDIESIARSSF
ncbi:hypothetical protein K2D_39060 [Planctomycetes bacterium K2D]|uniref:Uncharacterized protein n=1 Tax=Botrimarina mediterranea TaxID=2528022 RepID=A0A518KCY1_9BACT|nr:hypothetical protein Spa11_38650 [Botrimarina mediterranea]QDV80280.1 hypothetical protein K2D_39060 [Planctomycetes bacterium K2D]